MKIKINPYDPKSIDNALTQVRAYKADLERKKNLLIGKLAEIGLQVASVGFALADYDGTNDVSVTINQTGTGVNITASGQAVCFIEFGSGVKYGYGYPSEDKPAGMAGIGEYGKGQGANEKGWWYGYKQHTYGNPPAMAMLTARAAVLEQVTQIAREVFG